MSGKNKAEMADAITAVLTKNDSIMYSDLSDDELLDYAIVIWDYHADLRDEWARRQMMKAAAAR